MSVLVEAPAVCPGCGVEPGFTHREACEVERCSNCALLRSMCSCTNHEPKLSFWTGYFPGDEAARLFGVDHSALNELIQMRRQAVITGGPH
jgi:hypothetical protein